MILWGGIVSGPTFLNSGGRYNPGADSWIATTTTSAPGARAGHTAVWTGSEMMVWGGQGASHVIEPRRQILRAISTAYPYAGPNTDAHSHQYKRQRSGFITSDSRRCE